MCGIVGIVDRVAGFVEPEKLQVLNASLAHRGPDGEGYFVDGAVGLGMRRLAIIDIKQGSQPFFSRNREVVAFQNGEIYNYVSLRRELLDHGFQFVSQSDTEVLAHGYAHWGLEGLLSRIDGMFALSIFDRKTHELHLARDRFGEKPLFYVQEDGRFAFSSSMLTLASLPWVDAQVDALSLSYYFALHYVPFERTILSSIKRVLPGQCLTLNTQTLKTKLLRYYQPDLQKSQHSDSDDLRSRLEKAVQSRLIADVPVGVFLSGGVDSSLIAALAARENPRTATFSMGFASANPALDESAYARKVSEHLGTAHHHFVFDSSAFQDLLPKVASALDEPVGDQAMLPLYWLSREASKHVKVVLSGEGADEIFGGYSYYEQFASSERSSTRSAKWHRKLFRLSKSATPDSLCNSSLGMSSSGFPLLTDFQERQKLVSLSHRQFEEHEDEFAHWLSTAKSSLTSATAADLATWLPDDLLVKLDRMTMAHSLEGRAPYLDPSVVEYGLGLSDSHKISGSRVKCALRDVAGSLLPDEICNRGKQGFVLPMESWLHQWLSSQQSIAEYCKARELSGLDMGVLSRAIQTDFDAGIVRVRFVFASVMLLEWWMQFQRQRAQLREALMNAAPLRMAVSMKK